MDTAATLERSAMAKAQWRIVPLLLAGYLVCYIDRLNVGFAALTANKDLGLSPAAYGWGAGVLFLGYCLFEPPSNLALQRFGARLWLSRIMVTWGLISAGMAWVKTPNSFFVMRFLLGVAEAGFLPGVILYLTWWLPQRYRGRYIAVFALGIPLSGLIGAPLSGLIMQLDGAGGLKGWQWLYLCEGLPAVLLGVVTAVLLRDRPAQAAWLTDEERGWLQGELDTEAAARPQAQPVSVWALARNPRLIWLALIFFGTGVPSYGLNLWLPQIVKAGGLTVLQTGFVTALPYLFGCVAMLVWGRLSDGRKARAHDVAAALALAGVALGLCLFARGLPLQIALVSVAAIGVFGMKGPFLAMVSEAFTARTAAAGIALVSAFGNLSGWLAPYGVGLIKTWTASFTWSLAAMGAVSIVTALALLPWARRDARPI